MGPSHDRLEAEADRVAQSILSTPSGPSSAPAISPLGANSATRKPVQREESRPIEKREEDKTEQKRKALTQVIKPKKQAGLVEDLTKKGAGAKAQKKGTPSPAPKKRDEKAQKKAAPISAGLIQTKANPRPKEEEGKNYVIRDGIVVIPRGAVVMDGTVI